LGDDCLSPLGFTSFADASYKSPSLSPCDYPRELARIAGFRLRLPILGILNIAKLLNIVVENSSKVDHSLNCNIDQIMIEKQKSYKSDSTKTEQNSIDIWESHVKEREQILAQVAKAARVSRIRNWIELIFMLGFIYYMLYDMYKDGDLDNIIKFLT
jgi:hypothetical protein